VAIVVTIFALFLSTVARDTARRPLAPVRGLSGMGSYAGHDLESISEESDDIGHAANARTALIRR
jgi:hypothetical protein